MGNKAVVVGVSVVSLVVGAIAGYRYAINKLENDYNSQVDFEVNEAKKYYENKYVGKEQDPALVEAEKLLGSAATDEDFENLRAFSHATDAMEAMRAYQGGDSDENLQNLEEDIPQQENRAIEVEYLQVDRDYQQEVASRDKNKPYVVSVDEYFENDMEYTQVQITYYAGDNTLVDSRENPLDDGVDGVLGLENLTRFGSFSNDPNVVYIRNDTFRLDVELTRNEGKYGVQIAGFPENEEIGTNVETDHEWHQHTNTPRTRFDSNR